MILSTLALPAQHLHKEMTALDRYAQSAPKSLWQDLPGLTDYLTENADTDYKKVRAIYVWIITHIDYDRAAADADKRSNRTIADVLVRRQAICYGYAQLFQAMCTHAGVQSVVVHGYAREEGRGSGSLSTPNHSWNAVKVDGEWKLLDATWGAGSLAPKAPLIQEQEDDHFLPSPQQFVQSRLPGDPSWQLLGSPVPADLFFQSPQSIPQHLLTKAGTYSFQDSIAIYIRMSPSQRRLLDYERTYHFYPTPENAGQLGHGLIDQAGILADSLEQLQLQSSDAQDILDLNEQVIRLCRRANRLTKLYDWQQELYISSLINQGVSLYNLPTEEPDVMDDRYRTILSLLEEASVQLEGAEDNYYTRMTRRQCDQYMELIRSYIDEE